MCSFFSGSHWIARANLRNGPAERTTLCVLTAWARPRAKAAAASALMIRGGAQSALGPDQADDAGAALRLLEHDAAIARSLEVRRACHHSQIFGGELFGSWRFQWNTHGLTADASQALDSELWNLWNWVDW
jgi:hypothetical protein